MSYKWLNVHKIFIYVLKERILILIKYIESNIFGFFTEVFPFWTSHSNVLELKESSVPFTCTERLKTFLG